MSSNFAKINNHLMDALDRLASSSNDEQVAVEVAKTRAIVEIVKVQVEMANTMIHATTVAYEHGLQGGAKQVLGNDGN